MKNKIILLCITIALTTNVFSKNIENHQKEIKQEISNQNEKDYIKVRDRWVEFLIGIPQTNKILNTTEYDKFIRIISFNESEADKVYKNINLAENRKSIFKNAENMNSGVDILIQYDSLLKISKAYITPGTKYYKNEKIKKQINEALEWLYVNAYHEELPELGNWWQWELGIPKKLNDILMVMYNDVPKDKRIKYLKASQYFQPYAKWSGSSPSASYSTTPNKRLSTGGNRIDTSIISFLRGILMEDITQINDGLEAAVEVGELVTVGDGFYKDGSFVQHDNVAYSGTYAEVLFSGLGSILWMIDGTEFKIDNSKLTSLYESILNGYSYLMINGGINDSVNGRSISRDNSNDLTRGKVLLSSIVLLSENAPVEYQRKLKSLIKKVVLDNNYYSIVDKEDNPLVRNILNEIMENETIQPLKVNGTKIFGGMDRAVYFNDKGGKVVVSMHSNRIANYETMNGENLKGWYTGEGMTYIYGLDSSSYVEFWPTVDKYHLPGVTNSMSLLADKSGERRIKALLSPKAFVGGVATDKMAFIGMDLLSWNTKTEAKKSWLMKDGIILAIASNISSRDGLLHTTLDNRILKNGEIYINGERLIGNLSIKNPKNLSINFNENYAGENIGYKVLRAPELNLEIKDMSGNWKNIGGSLEKEITQKYFLTYINHGKNPKNASYVYLILPMFSKEEVDNYDASRFELLQVDEEAHIIRDKKDNTVAIHFWKDKVNSFEKIKVYSAVSIIKQENNEVLNLFISDPTQLNRLPITLELDGKYQIIETTDETLDIQYKKALTILKVNLNNNGSTQNIKLKKIK